MPNQRYLGLSLGRSIWVGLATRYRVDKYRHRLCLVNVELAVFKQETEYRRQNIGDGRRETGYRRQGKQNAGVSKPKPALSRLLYSVSSGAARAIWL